jgi:phytoene/squalene synthetase
MITIKDLSNAHKIAETIACKDKNNLSLTSSFFKDKTKYRVFCSYYALMRVVDDHIDNLPPYDQRSKKLIDKELKYLDSWERIVTSSMKGLYPDKNLFNSTGCNEAEAICDSFIDSYKTIPVDEKLWTDFFNSMRSDLSSKEFATWSDFLKYSEGATVAPTTIYLILITSKLNASENIYESVKNFDIHECGRNLGIFAYLGHIIRDLAEDIREASTRICITNEDMAAHGLSIDAIRSDAFKHHAAPKTQNLVRELLLRAKNYHVKGRALAEELKDFIGSDCQFILELIITIYEHIIMKIESADFDPMSNRHYLTRREKAMIVKSVAFQTGFPLPNLLGNQR